MANNTPRIGLTKLTCHGNGRLLHWAGHSGVKRTLELPKWRVWWPTIERDVTSFISPCTSCTQNKTPRKHPADLFHLLPIPNCPWSKLLCLPLSVLLDLRNCQPFLKSPTAQVTIQHVSILSIACLRMLFTCSKIQLWPTWNWSGQGSRKLV